ncbi:chromosome segregation ATPase [Longispora fulva]|nr:DUF4404 family protein [Longispora fulva]GIG55911.1 chromosome segregation ATPase [Longispora fulva]
MSARELHESLDDLREQVDDDPGLSAEDHDAVGELFEACQALLESRPQEDTLVERAEALVERFEVEHPAVAASVHQVAQALINMGV